MPGTLAGKRVLVVEVESDIAANLGRVLGAEGVVVAPFMALTGYDAWAIPEGHRAVPHLTRPLVMARGVEAAGRMAANG